MNHVNLTFHLATRRLIYQNSPLFFFFFFPHLLPIRAAGSTVKTLHGWKGSGSGLVSNLCQDRAGMPSISPPGWSLDREIVSITQCRRFLPLLAWLVPVCALQLQPHQCLHSWLGPESPVAPARAKLLESFPGGVRASPLRDAQPSWVCVSSLGWKSLSFGLGEKLELSESPA